jgi:hypothetical protein
MFDAINNEEWNFPIEVHPTPNAITGEWLENSKQIIRTDTNEVLGVHKSAYKPVLHSDVVNSIEDAVLESQVSKDFYIDTQIFENGAKLKGTVHFRDLYIENKKSAEVGDIVNFKVDFLNSYDGSWSYMQKAEGHRLVCKNGMVSGLAIAMSKFKHTTSINIEGSANKIQIGLETFMTNKNKWERWTETSIEDWNVENFLKATVCKTHTRQSGVSKTNEKQLEILLGLWEKEKNQLGNNKWALYNCLTYWSTHTQDARTPHIASFNREGDVGRAINSKEWTSLDTYYGVSS